MARIAIGYRNLADTGTMSASGYAGAMLPTMLQTAHVAERWRTLGTTAWFVCDLGSLRTVAAVAVMGLNLAATATFRVRYSTVDSTGAAGDADDTSTISNGIDPAYGMAVHLRTAPITCRYVRVDFTDASQAYIEAGRLAVLETLWQPLTNFEYGWQWSYEDPSRQSRSWGGQTWVEAQAYYRMAEFTLPNVRHAERTGHVFPLQRLHGLRHDILVCRDTDTTNLGRDCIWGLMTRLLPLSNPRFNQFSHRISVAERL